MEETIKVEEYLKDLLNVMVSRAEKEVDAVMPGYTHLQVSSHQEICNS
jgi:argininosuccinate lyase